jgi:hypothetical protein
MTEDASLYGSICLVDCSSNVIAYNRLCELPLILIIDCLHDRKRKETTLD